jgi:hypothetical protein
MTAEKHDPWALLREAREALVRAENRMMAPPHQVSEAIQRIDAALAERQDSAQNAVDWRERQGSYIHDDGVHELRVYLWGDEWHWHTVVEYRANGTCATEDDAKSAAIAAARGL